MLKIRLMALALAGASLVTARGGTIVENFSSNPLQNGWAVFGDTNLFQWDSTNHDLRVIWDSSQPNSYYYHPLGTTMTRADDFSLSFDLDLTDIGLGIHSDLTNSFTISLGFLNLSVATGPGFLRGTSTNSPDLAEFSYFWDAGYGATIWPTFVDTNSDFNYNGASDYAVVALADGQAYHISMAYTASNQTAITTVTNSQQTSGVFLSQLLNSSSGDFRLDTFSISSYNDAGQVPTYAGSVLAHGTVANIVAVAPPPPVQHLTGSAGNGLWQAQWNGRSAWIYTLQRTMDFQSWTNVASLTNGVTGTMVLSDPSSAAGHAFYRVQANLP